MIAEPRYRSRPLWSHTPVADYQINSVALSDDGHVCLYGTASESGQGNMLVGCHLGKQQPAWQVEVGGDMSREGVFWVALSGNGHIGAAGGKTDAQQGFLQVYDIFNHGRLLLDEILPARVNQVALNQTGDRLLVVFNGRVRLYFQAQDKRYQLVDEYPLCLNETNQFYSKSCAFSTDGSRAVVAGINYDLQVGCVFCFDVDSTLKLKRADQLDSGVMRVAITHDGSYWAASMQDGSCAAFCDNHIEGPLWRYLPQKTGLYRAYGLAITLTSEPALVVACGANIRSPQSYWQGMHPFQSSSTQEQGFLYVLKDHLHNPGRGRYPMPTMLWGRRLAYSVNPGVSLDREATLVTATDGLPGSDVIIASGDSPGNFYLFDAGTGCQRWHFHTQRMNWPMVLSQDGKKVLGGSDNGSVYYWDSDALETA